MRRVLGHSRYGYKVSFNLESESWFREKNSPTAATAYPHIRQFMLNSIVSTSAFLAGRSSNITCLHVDGTRGLCRPIYGLGLPLIISLLILAHKLVSDWWIARKERPKEFILPPRMCHRELKKRADNLSCFGKHGRGGMLARDSQMQNHGLLRGCPWELSIEDVDDWLWFVW